MSPLSDGSGERRNQSVEQHDGGHSLERPPSKSGTRRVGRVRERCVRMLRPVHPKPAWAMARPARTPLSMAPCRMHGAIAPDEVRRTKTCYFVEQRLLAKDRLCQGRQKTIAVSMQWSKETNWGRTGTGLVIVIARVVWFSDSQLDRLTSTNTESDTFVTLAHFASSAVHAGQCLVDKYANSRQIVPLPAC